MKRIFSLFFSSLLFSSLYAATYTVTVLTDNGGVNPLPGAGTGTLRQAIVDANANVGADIIDFNVGGVGGPFTIALQAALPDLTDNSGVTIDGWTNAGNNGTPNTVPVFSTTAANPMVGGTGGAVYKIILSNSTGVIPTGLRLTSNNNIIQGLVLQDFGDGTVSANDIAITITGNSNQILGCIIGLDYTGTTRGTRTNIGISISGNTNIIGNGTAAGANLISGMNTNGTGVYLRSTSSTNSIKGNMIGLQADGATNVVSDDQDNGIYIINTSTNNTIGGTASGDGNVISSNTSRGIYITSSAVVGSTIIGNIIGPQATGANVVTSNNQALGIRLEGTQNNIIGGNTAGARNIISANGEGIGVTGVSSGNIIKGNYIGLDITGTTFISGSSQTTGIFNFGSGAITIGGTGANEGNVISGNTGNGIYISSGTSSIVGNIIGLQANGLSNVASNAQTNGIYFYESGNATIGGNTVAARNIISGNLSAGIYLFGAGTNTIKGNYIGLGSDGSSFVVGSSQDYGIFFTNSPGSCINNTIGGTSSGEGNVISGNTVSGIHFNSSDVATIIGNIIGLQANGTGFVSSNQQQYGIYMLGSPGFPFGNPCSNITIGGSTAASRNIISGNQSYGITLGGALSTGIVIKGNYIGLDSTGTTFVTGSSQDYGIDIGGATVIIGGTISGEGNVISGNIETGIVSSSTSANSILGNIIGPQKDGATYVAGAGYTGANTQNYGIRLIGSRNNTIGGNTPGARNIISANEDYGIHLSGAACSTNVVKGNYIGLDINGTTFIASSSQDYGVYITSSASSNVIGGTAAGEGNVISGNVNGATLISAGIYINSTAAAGNTVIGNIIGPQADGATLLAGAGYTGNSTQDIGVRINSSPNNTIGGNTSAHRNIISANNTYGVYITGASSTGNSIKGNYIGLDITGTSFIVGSSQDYGVYIISSATSNTIGGTAAGEGNVISGNSNTGVYFWAPGNSVFGNIIGLQANGSSFLVSSTQTYGIYVNGANNIIGGATSGHRNIISGNDLTGVYLVNIGSTGNTIKGNYIGLDITGTTFISGSSQDNGVYFATITGTTIGGIAAGEGNVISGNTNSGISITSTTGNSNSIYGNIIGLQANGTSFLTSSAQTYGVYIYQSSNNTIGGNTSAHRNVISGNATYGVYITAITATGNSVKGNYIGLDINGTSFITDSNQDYGVYLTSQTSNNTIGGSGVGEGNVISGNSNTGVYTNSTAVAGNFVLGNIIGPQENGTSYLASNTQAFGVNVTNSPNNIIGNTTGRNIISGNETYGVYITALSATGNSIKGNYIGPSSALGDLGKNVSSFALLGVSSQDYGVYITSSATNNIVGGTAAGEGNTIAYNTANGVYLTGAGTTGNLISGNLIYYNTGNPILLVSSANGAKAAPVLDNNLGVISGTAAAGDIIEVFHNSDGDCNNATHYAGTTTADGSGVWSLVAAIPASDYILATARSATNNTSECSICRLLPIDLTFFEAECSGKNIEIHWETATELNNDYFTILRSNDARNFEEIARIKGAGNSNQPVHYTYIDEQISSGPKYYRLKQTDYDGIEDYFDIQYAECVDFFESLIKVYPNPNNGNFTIEGLLEKEEISIHNSIGQIVYRTNSEVAQKNNIILGKVPSGIYIIEIRSPKRFFSRKLLIGN